MSVDDHNILVPFAGKLICQRQSEDACTNDDNPVAWVHHGDGSNGQCACKLATCEDPVVVDKKNIC